MIRVKIQTLYLITILLIKQLKAYNIMTLLPIKQMMVFTKELSKTKFRLNNNRHSNLLKILLHWKIQEVEQLILKLVALDVISLMNPNQEENLSKGEVYHHFKINMMTLKEVERPIHLLYQVWKGDLILLILLVDSKEKPMELKLWIFQKVKEVTRKFRLAISLINFFST